MENKRFQLKVKCECGYEWEFKPTKRPNPRKATCPNCDAPVILRPSKLEVDDR